MKLAESVTTAWAAVAESDIPDHIRDVAFKEVLRSLLGTASQNVTAAGSHGVPSTPHAKLGNSTVDGDREQNVSAVEAEILQRMHNETGISVDKLERVFYIDDGAVKLNGPHTLYGANTADQARTVAQIVTVVRKLGMGHSDTSFEIIKEACESKYCYDSKNFAPRHMPTIAGFVVKGENRGRRLEAKGSGISAFPDLIDKVLGVS